MASKTITLRRSCTHQISEAVFRLENALKAGFLLSDGQEED